MEEQAMRKMFAITLGGMMLFAATSAVQADTILFQDNFGNGVVKDSDGTPATGTNVWKTLLPTYGSFTESGGGTLVATAGGAGYTGTNQETNMAGADSSNVKTTSPIYNFLAPGSQAKTISGTVSMNSNGAQNFWDDVFRISLASQTSTTYEANDALSLRFRGNPTNTVNPSNPGFDVALSYKVNASNKNPEGAGVQTALLVSQNPTSQNGVYIPGTLTGFAWTIDQTGYNLVVYYNNLSNGLPNSTIWTGLWTGNANGLNLNLADWNTPSGDAMLFVQHTLNSNAGTVNGATATYTWDQFTVSQIPEPATLGLLAMGGLFMLARRRA
ncbi:MAG: PEP-CTERM sorting domain-containing protein [Phycisphaerales bacterium]